MLISPKDTAIDSRVMQNIPKVTAIYSTTDADQPEGTAIDLRLLRKYMDVYSRPPDRSVGRFKLGLYECSWHKKTTHASQSPLRPEFGRRSKRVCAGCTNASLSL
jgi:hypothetical protein